VHDAVIRGGRTKEKTIEQMVDKITLPAHLQAFPELREAAGEADQDSTLRYSLLYNPGKP